MDSFHFQLTLPLNANEMRWNILMIKLCANARAHLWRTESDNKVFLEILFDKTIDKIELTSVHIMDHVDMHWILFKDRTGSKLSFRTEKKEEKKNWLHFTIEWGRRLQIAHINFILTTDRIDYVEKNILIERSQRHDRCVSFIVARMSWARKYAVAVVCNIHKLNWCIRRRCSLCTVHRCTEVKIISQTLMCKFRPNENGFISNGF